MKKYILLFAFAFFLFGCEETIDPPQQEPDFTCEESPETCDLTADNNLFGFELVKKLHEDEADENLFISPLSVSSALAMTVNGAKGETKTQMLEAMQLAGWDMEHLNQAFKTLLETLPNLDEQVKMEIANSIWYKLGYDIRPLFLQTNSSYYASEVNELDFSDPGAPEIINGWVEDKTHGLIDQVIDQIPAEAVMYLINAIYFKGFWLNQFETENTQQGSFILENGNSTLVDMMDYGGEIDLPYFETENFQAVDLAYGDSIFSMSIFLPKGNYSITEMVNSLSAENWDLWTNSFQKKSIKLRIPKFEMEYEITLNRALKALGMQTAFTTAADFSDINGIGGLMVSKVKHKSFIEVDEKGTEAAAVTVVEIVVTSVPDTPFFIANKPFLFVIRENKTNSVLFIGKMMNPNEG